MDAERSPRALEAKSLAADALLAVAMAGISVSILVSLAGRDVAWEPGLAAPLVVVHGLSLAARRRWPERVLAVQVVTGIAVVLLGLPPVVLGVAILIGLYTVAA
ncbi:MAG TPA: hypothetical protein VE712_02695, partial [Actinomycetota bacterium]|nr:hypothetical protein [Actinomycetota bacterium]